MVPRRFSLRLVAAESRTLMDKCRPSRKQLCHRFDRAGLAFAMAATGVIALWPNAVTGIAISQSDALKVGKRVWQNECNGTISGLTSWNQGEDFASLGIGHFIWYPKGRQGPFEESFPKLVSFVSSRGAKLPTLLLGVGRVNRAPGTRVPSFCKRKIQLR